MKIQVSTDNHIEGTTKLVEWVEATVEERLKRFDERITRVEVHLSDENSGHKSIGRDKRCLIEARLSGLQPVSVTEQASEIDDALRGALDKMRTVLDRTLGRLEDRKWRNAPGAISDDSSES